MERYVDSLDAALRIHQVDLVQLYFRVVECHVVQSHHAMLRTQHSTPFTDIERCDPWSLLHRPHLVDRNSSELIYKVLSSWLVSSTFSVAQDHCHSKYRGCIELYLFSLDNLQN